MRVVHLAFRRFIHFWGRNRGDPMLTWAQKITTFLPRNGRKKPQEMISTLMLGSLWGQVAHQEDVVSEVAAAAVC